MDIEFDFTNKTALVVGGSRGIGRQVVQDLLRSGAEVFYISREKDPTSEATHLKCDLLEEHQIYNAFSMITNLDFLINVAAINFCKKIEDIEIDEWDRVLATNLRSFYLTCKLAVEKMKPNKTGKIVNVSSIAGRNKSIVSGVHYTASKAGIIGLTRQLAHEVSPHGININVVCPSQTLTDMLKQSMSEADLKKLSAEIPLRRLATPSEQSLPILFLCSEASSYMTGCALDINGGQL
jgi:3-oxoacyl-[acyl-carrier protein] reductase